MPPVRLPEICRILKKILKKWKTSAKNKEEQKKKLRKDNLL